MRAKVEQRVEAGFLVVKGQNCVAKYVDRIDGHFGERLTNI